MLSSRPTMFTACLAAAAAVVVLLSAPFAAAEEFVVYPGELQDALDKVRPGDTITLTPGDYYETVATRTAGTEDAYITIRGESYGAVVKGVDEGASHIFDVQHSYYHLDRFTIDGHHGGNAYADKCLYVQTNRDDGNKVTMSQCEYMCCFFHGVLVFGGRWGSRVREGPQASN